jgi:hypothetical protein
VPVPPTGGSLSGQVGFKWRRRLFGQLPSRQLLANAGCGALARPLTIVKFTVVRRYLTQRKLGQLCGSAEASSTARRPS